MAKVYQFPDQIRGDDWFITLTMIDENNNPYNISGNQYWFTLKSDIDLADVDAELQVGPFVAGSPDASLGILEFRVPGVFTKTLEAKAYNYDIQEVTPVGEVQTVLIGKVKIRKDVTLNAVYVGAPTNDVSGQGGVALYEGITTNTTPTTINLGGVPEAHLTVNENSVMTFTALIVGKDTVTGESCGFELSGAIERDSGDSTQIIGTVGKQIFGRENALFDANISAGINYLNITVTAASTNSTHWAARVVYSELSY